VIEKAVVIVLNLPTLLKRHISKISIRILVEWIHNKKLIDVAGNAYTLFELIRLLKFQISILILEVAVAELFFNAPILKLVAVRLRTSWSPDNFSLYL
jgi:hypothetical protein